MLENMHDLPYVQSKHFGPETVSALTRLAFEMRQIIPEKTPCGIQVLACGNQEALAISKVAGLQFIRAEGFVFTHIADEGLTDACAGHLLRYRRHIQADDVLIFADLKKKHSSHAITQDVSLLETAHIAEFFMADGVIVTGKYIICVNQMKVFFKTQYNCIETRRNHGRSSRSRGSSCIDRRRS